MKVTRSSDDTVTIELGVHDAQLILDMVQLVDWDTYPEMSRLFDALESVDLTATEGNDLELDEEYLAVFFGIGPTEDGE